LIRGLPEDTSKDELRTLGAAAASAGGLAMFHAEGLTPESPGARSRAADRLLPHRKVTREILETVAGRFSAPEGTPLDAVCLGTPHYSLAELRRLAELLGQAPGALRIPIIVTLSRATLAQAATEGLDAALEARGVTLVTDTCTYYGSVISVRGGAVMTDSAKWAWYGGGNLGVRPVLAGLEACVASALVGCVSGPMVHLP
jgi:predicted aconitase